MSGNFSGVRQPLTHKELRAAQPAIAAWVSDLDNPDARAVAYKAMRGLAFPGINERVRDLWDARLYFIAMNLADAGTPDQAGEWLEKFRENVANFADPAREVRWRDAITDNWDFEPEPRRWLVPGWIPEGRAGLLCGPGGVGKSTFAVQLCAAIARGCGRCLDVEKSADSEWCGGLELAGGQGLAILVTWEDEPDEVRRRIPGHPCDLGDSFRILNLGGFGPLFGHGGDMRMEPHWTATGRSVRDYAAGARLLVIDGAASSFGAPENDRAIVRRYLGDLDAWARESSVTVLQIAHPPKSKDGEPYSGCTDWRNASRYLLELNAATIPGDLERKGSRLRVEKTNYSKLPTPIWLRGRPWKQCGPVPAAEWHAGGPKAIGFSEAPPS